MKMNKAALQDELRKTGITFRSKATRPELLKLIAEAVASGQSKPAANGQSKPAAKKIKLGAKAVLREKFNKAGVVTLAQIDKIAEKCDVTRSTVLTAMTDLKNEKYAGKAGPLNIEKDADGYRLAE